MPIKTLLEKAWRAFSFASPVLGLWPPIIFPVGKNVFVRKRKDKPRQMTKILIISRYQGITHDPDPSSANLGGKHRGNTSLCNNRQLATVVFYHLWLFLAQKSARDVWEPFTGASQVFVTSYFCRRNLCRETSSTPVRKTLVICECKTDLSMQTTTLSNRT
jgi:hypothetical protein